MKKNKLELTWIGKDKRPKLEPRILLEDPSQSYHAKQRVNDNDIFDNKLIFGDNLLALKALEQEYAGKVKCVFIDPPYNTGSAFRHYDDGLEHSVWLSLMRDRLKIIHNLLSVDGSLWITIDDNEAHYLKVICDEIFGRGCFVTSFIWRKVDSPNDNKVPITPDHDYVLCFSRTQNGASFKQKPDASILDAYKRPDEESSRPYRDRLLKKNGKNSLRKDRPSMYFPVIAPDGTEILPMHDDGREACWALGIKAVNKLVSDGKLIWKQRNTNNVIRWVPYTREYAPTNPSRPYATIWNDLDTTRQTKSHHRQIYGYADGFDTPKPEDLIERVLNICTEKSDIVVDSFAGSGTTGAVAHKMGRKWIMVELGEHCHSHIIPRLQQVINGEDQGGISKSVNWQGGGGFRYYTLAPSLLEKDKWGNWVVNKDYNAEMLSEAICKLEGFSYAPSDTEWWNHGTSTETDFIYITTQNQSVEKLQQLSDEVGGDKTLLVCCGSFRCKPDRFDNLTIKKIPKMVLSRCEWAHDDYSLNIENLPQMEKDPEQESLFPEDGGAS